jgi:hypothetical protein
VRPAANRTLPGHGPAAPGTPNARSGEVAARSDVLLNRRSHFVSALNIQADRFRLQNVLAPLVHVLYLEPIDPYRSELRMPELHNPYIQWNPRYQMFSIFHNGGIQAFSEGTPLVFDTYAEAAAHLTSVNN